MTRLLPWLAPTAFAAVLAAVGLVIAPAGGVPTLAGPSDTDVPDAVATAAFAEDDPTPAVTPSSTVPVRSGLLEAQPDAAVTARPVEVKLPSIGVHSDVVSVGVDDDQLLEVPSATETGWYRHGSSPGDAGATVLAAHVDFAGVPGVFFELSSVEPGTTVLVATSDGKTHRYVVEGVVLHDKAALPAEQLFRTDGPEVLHLITCGGVFDAAARTYLGNVVLTARPA